MIKKARKVGEQIRSENGVDQAIEHIFQDLDYSASQIKKLSDVVDAGAIPYYEKLRGIARKSSSLRPSEEKPSKDSDQTSAVSPRRTTLKNLFNFSKIPSINVNFVSI